MIKSLNLPATISNMSNKQLSKVIVDSGGSLTSWAFIYKDGTRQLIDTESFHPVNFNEDFFERNRLFIEKNVPNKASLFFFGAGMGKNENKQVLSDFFHPYFNEMIILTDIQGLALSLNMKDGAIAIMGTGSVLVEVYNDTIRQQIGGLGHLIGDEGSAYYFGKLVLIAFREKQLTNDQEVALRALKGFNLEDIDELLKNKYVVASLAQYLNQELFENFHKENIHIFFETHFKRKINVNNTAFIGSYAFFERDLIINELRRLKISESKFIRKPIDLFCDKFANN